MASRQYCSRVAEELEIWSAKLHDLSDKIGRIPSIDKYRLQPQVEELHMVITELDDRICDMMTRCIIIDEARDIDGDSLAPDNDRM